MKCRQFSFYLDISGLPLLMTAVEDHVIPHFEVLPHFLGLTVMKADVGARAEVIVTSSADLMNGIRALAVGESYLQPSLGIELALWDRSRESVFQLTSKEEKILHLIVLGHTNAAVAMRVGWSVRTVETHRVRIHNKTGCRTRAELVEYARVTGLFDNRIIASIPPLLHEGALNRRRACEGTPERNGHVSISDGTRAESADSPPRNAMKPDAEMPQLGFDVGAMTCRVRR